MLSKVNKILYASDIEKGSRPALRAAVNLCGRYQSEITYLHVIEPISSAIKSRINDLIEEADLDELYNQSLVNLMHKIEKRVDDFLSSEVQQSDVLKMTKIKSRIEEGIAWKTIVKVANEMDADLIVMGTRTSSSAGQFFTGSTANKVMLNSKRPLLIIPLTDKE